MRPNIAVFALLAMTGCAAPAPLTPSEGPWQFSGTVFRLDGDRVGRPIAGAELTVLSGANANTRVKTDPTGHYVFRALDGGRFTVAIAAPGYHNATPVVDLYRDIEANFALRPQP